MEYIEELEYFRGDSIPICIPAKYKDGSKYIYKKGDVVKLGITKLIGDDSLDYLEEQVIEEEISQVEFNIPPETTRQLLGKYYLEAELTYNEGLDVSTLFQVNLTIKEDKINERNSRNN